DADPHAGALKVTQQRARLGAGPEVDGAAVGGEPLEQRPPFSEQLVELARGRRAILRHVELDPRSARDVLEPVAPEWPRVREHGVQIESDRLHSRMLDSRSNRRAVRELRCKS